MRTTNKIIITIILIAVMLLGVGYSAVQNVTLNIAGSAAAISESVTNENIGDYIDLGNHIVGTEDTTDDWRILYVDEEGTVYAILADYLPNSTGYAKNAGLDISKSETEDYTYSVYSKTNRDTLLNGLTTESNWQGLANGISGATVTGTPTAELLMKSYNTKNGTTFDYTTFPILDTSDDLYVPHTETIDDCDGYLLASAYGSAGGSVYCFVYEGDVSYVSFVSPYRRRSSRSRSTSKYNCNKIRRLMDSKTRENRNNTIISNKRKHRRIYRLRKQYSRRRSNN